MPLYLYNPKPEPEVFFSVDVGNGQRSMVIGDW
jgi:hypothetical protein